MATLSETQAVLCYTINGCSGNYKQVFYLLEENIYTFGCMCVVLVG